jgi:hypothetical protein
MNHWRRRHEDQERERASWWHALDWQTPAIDRQRHLAFWGAAPMSKENGFLPLRRGLWEHVRDGRMSITEALAFIYICSQADTRTGIWKGCSKSLSGELGIPERTARDVLEKMEHGDYIRRFAVPGRHICYPILIHKFLITQGEHNGEHLNAKESTTPADLRYISREQGVEQGVEHGAAQRRSEKREERKAKPCFALPDWVPLETWNEFLEMRESLRATPTEKAKALLVEKLQKLKCSGQDPKSVLEQSIERSWKGVFPVSTFYWLAAETGMRAGELCGLRVDHIDLRTRSGEGFAECLARKVPKSKIGECRQDVRYLIQASGTPAGLLGEMETEC